MSSFRMAYSQNYLFQKVANDHTILSVDALDSDSKIGGLVSELVQKAWMIGVIKSRNNKAFQYIICSDNNKNNQYPKIH